MYAKTKLTKALMAGMATSSLIALVGVAPAAAAQGDAFSDTKLADRSNPAVDVVMTTYSGMATARSVDFSAAGAALFERGISLWSSGEITSASGLLEYVFTRVRRDPESYLRVYGPTRTHSYTVHTVGSAFFLTPDGYLATARHVVTADNAVKQEVADMGAAAFAKADATELIKTFQQYDMSDQAMSAITDAVSTFDRSHVTVSIATPKVEVELGVAAGDGSRSIKAVPAEVAYRSSQELGADIAVLRINGQNYPTLPLAQATPSAGSQVHFTGFPADATFVKGMSTSAMTQPTTTVGRVTAIKETDTGIRLLQTDASVSPGGSGGPFLDDSGNVVGVLVSGAVDDRGVSVGENYMMPIDVLKDALRRINVTPSLSPTSTIYNQALDNYYQHYYTRALPQFETARSLFPEHGYVAQFISDTQTAISQGKDETPSGPPLAVLVGAAGAAVLILLAGAFLLLRVRKARRPSSVIGAVDLAAGLEPVPTATDATHESAEMPGPTDEFAAK